MMTDFFDAHFEGIIAIGGMAAGAISTLAMMVYRRGVQFNQVQRELKSAQSEVHAVREEIKANDQKQTEEHRRIWKAMTELKEDVAYIRGKLEKKNGE